MWLGHYLCFKVQQKETHRDWWILFVQIFIGIFTIMCSTLFGVTAYNASKNLTINEQANFHRYDYLKDGLGKKVHYRKKSFLRWLKIRNSRLSGLLYLELTIVNWNQTFSRVNNQEITAFSWQPDKFWAISVAISRTWLQICQAVKKKPEISGF